MSEYRTLWGQSLVDVALQKYGTVESIVKLFSENESELKSFNNFIFDGKSIQIDDAFSKNEFVTQTLTDQRKEISTGVHDVTIGKAFSNAFSTAFN